MQKVVIGLGFVCLFGLAVLMMGGTTCRSDGCLGLAFFALPLLIGFVVVTLLGTAIWRADQHGTEGLTTLFKVIVGIVASLTVLGASVAFLAWTA